MCVLCVMMVAVVMCLPYLTEQELSLIVSSIWKYSIFGYFTSRHSCPRNIAKHPIGLAHTLCPCED